MLFHIRYTVARSLFILCTHSVPLRFGSTSVTWPESLPKLKFDLPPIPKDLTPPLGEILFEHLNKIHEEFYNYSNDVLRTSAFNH